MRKFSSKLAGQQAGFTLIELVIVIVIIGILAAVAIPQFSNVTDDAKLAAVDGILSGYASAYGANKAMCDGFGTTSTKCQVSSPTCAGALATLMPGTGATGVFGSGVCKVTKGGVTSSASFVTAS